ncbi:hypothetical protein [Aquibium microcysteis]|uniref:hypothetical protein n=1 Tax=Aquibium microcysteis TaxID=675281 RepID=UPI00165CF037|nr:hypothetical protein [Aquibium microcysteis]
MASRNQLDLFGADQPEHFDEDAPPVYYHGDPDRVRARLHRLIAEARAAETVPWNDDDLRLYRKIVQQMFCGCRKTKRASSASTSTSTSTSTSRKRYGGCSRHSPRG